MQVTSNIGLKKPDYTDGADIAIINQNMDEIDKQINDRLKKADRNGVDLNTIFGTGTQGYAVGCTNTPTGEDGYFLDYYSPYTTTGYQEFTVHNTSTKYYRVRKASAWQPWQQISTTATWQCAVTNLANGFKSIADTPAWFTRNGKLVTVNNMILQTTTAVVTQNTIFIQNIPIEFRPSQVRGIVIKGSNGKLYNAGVTPYGTIYCDNSISIWETNLSLDLSVSYNL